MWSNPYNLTNLPVSTKKGASEYRVHSTLYESALPSEYLNIFYDYSSRMNTEQMDTEQIEEQQSYASRYYQENKDRIHQYRRESGLSRRAHLRYYEANKEIIKQKNLARYHRKKDEQLAQQLAQQLKIEEPKF